MRIYIRHGHKAYKNGKASWGQRDRPSERRLHSHDPPLTKEGIAAAATLAEELLSKYPIPSRIITSPYLRARETAMAMAGVVVKKCSPASIQIECRNDMSEYLGNHPDDSIDVDATTARYDPPHPETFHRFRDRIKAHSSNWACNDDVVWIITHGIVINEILHPFYPKQRIPYLGYIVMIPEQNPEIFFN